MTKKLLWPDDYRDPNGFVDEDPEKGRWAIFSPIEQPFEVIWVKSYSEFTNWITKNGLPDGICFDNSLGDFDKNGIEKTGYDCAKWLVEYCLDNNLHAPPFNSQSSEPQSRDLIMGLLTNLNKQTPIMDNKKTYKQCCSEVAIKHGIGKSLVTGHLPKYWEEASQIYANQFQEEIKSLKQENLLLEIHYDNKKTQLDSCGATLRERERTIDQLNERIVFLLNDCGDLANIKFNQEDEIEKLREELKSKNLSNSPLESEIPTKNN